MTLSFAQNELAALRAESAETLASRVLARVKVRSAGADCSGSARGTQTLPPDGVKIHLVFTCRSEDARRELELAALFAELARGHRHEAVFENGGKREARLLFEGRSGVSLVVSRADGNTASASSPAAIALGFVHMGVEHILTGFDHLVFLLGLVVVGLEKRRVLGVVTAFTLSHSLTLALSVLGVWSPSGAVVEPLIALSIAYVGVENLVARSFERRTLLAFAFGLVHGFGFAGALGDVGFGGSATALGLAAFNFGVELGQLAALAALLPALALLGRSPGLVRRVVPAVNAAVVVLGVTWFVLRVG